LKAAHCLDGLKPEDLVVVLTKDIRRKENGGSEIYDFVSSVIRIVIHEDYDPSVQWRNRQQPRHDIALIETYIYAPLGENAELSVLPYGWDRLNVAGLILEVAGFGMFDEKNRGRHGILHHAEVEGISNEKVMCQNL
jgi:hypothetical protein